MAKALDRAISVIAPQEVALDNSGNDPQEAQATDSDGTSQGFEKLLRQMTIFDTANGTCL
jgi:hypothetical protein